MSDKKVCEHCGDMLPEEDICKSREEGESTGCISTRQSCLSRNRIKQLTTRVSPGAVVTHSPTNADEY